MTKSAKFEAAKAQAMQQQANDLEQIRQDVEELTSIVQSLCNRLEKVLAPAQTEFNPGQNDTATKKRKANPAN